MEIQCCPLDWTNWREGVMAASVSATAAGFALSFFTSSALIPACFSLSLIGLGLGFHHVSAQPILQRLKEKVQSLSLQVFQMEHTNGELQETSSRLSSVRSEFEQLRVQYDATHHVLHAEVLRLEEVRNDLRREVDRLSGV